MHISLVMPTWNGAATLPAVLTALAAQDLEGVELLAVDSGSTDGTRELLTAAGFAVHQIPQREFNHGATRDLGIGLSSGEVVVLLVQDAEPVGPGFLRALIEPFAKNQSLAGVYGRQTPRPGANPILTERLRNWNAGRSQPQIQEVDSPAAFASLAPLNRLGRSAFDNVASAVRRSVWKEIPFGRRPFGEDVAWGRRVILAGHRIRFEPAAEVIHSHDRTPWAECKRLYCDHQNLHELFGVELIPRLGLVRTAIRNQRREYRTILDNLDLTAEERKRWGRWARRYAACEAVGVWLGARSAKWRAKGRWWFSLVDGCMRRGI